MAEVGITFSESNLALIDRDVIKRGRIDARASRLSVVSAAVREHLAPKEQSPIMSKSRTRSEAK